jgi:AraC family transcriptional regulator
LAKIAVEFEQAVARRALLGSPGRALARCLAGGPGWQVDDVVCDFGPQDRPFEERHSGFSIAVVAAGTFQYHGDRGRELMIPGSLLLGEEGHCFECRHDHASGDRCVAFRYDPAYFTRLAADAGFRRPSLGALRLPPVRALSTLVVRACAGLVGAPVDWEELSLQLAAQTLHLSAGPERRSPEAPPSSVARLTRALRAIERQPDAPLSLASLARESRLSPYHFLRTFQALAGVTPHQFLVRTRLRRAALRLTTEPTRILDIALDSGFGEVSNFNRAFRSEFGLSPRAYRQSPA